MRINNLILFNLIFLITLMTACANNNTADNDEKSSNGVKESDFPIVEEEITLDIFTGKSPRNVDIDWNDLLVWNEYEKLTNIHVNWTEQVGPNSLAEKRNLALGGGNLPDVFLASSLSNNDILKYGEQDVFLELNDLIDKYAPNLKQVMSDNPEIEKGMTFPNGNIYTMPTLTEANSLSLRVGAMPWIYEDWLDKLDMDLPETTEDFYHFLKAVKETDDDIVPLAAPNIEYLEDWLIGSFVENVVNDYLIDEEDLKFLQTSDEYKASLDFMHKLYSEGLIAQNIFSFDSNQFNANVTKGNYASIVYWDPEFTLGVSGFIGGIPLEGPDGVQVFESSSSPLSKNGSLVITKENPNPAATVRWADYFYSDEGSRLLYMGIEDETFIEENGEFKYVNKIMDAENIESKMAEYVPWNGVSLPVLRKEKYFEGAETTDASLKAAEQIEPYMPEEVVPAFHYTEDENKVMNTTGVDIEKYVNEMRDKFIYGSEPLSDENWKEYIENVENINLKEYMNVQEQAYDRYKDN